MSSNITNPSDNTKESGAKNDASSSRKGKTSMDLKKENMGPNDEEEEEEEQTDSEDDASDDEADEDFEEIDPSAIIPRGRRTRGVRVDYTSKEALEKAGLQGNEDEESDDDVEMKD